MSLLVGRKAKALHTDGPTDGRTDQWTNGRTHALIESLHRAKKPSVLSSNHNRNCNRPFELTSVSSSMNKICDVTHQYKLAKGHRKEL